jgi:transcriptional regulator with XRE-family HTH domain
MGEMYSMPDTMFVVSGDSESVRSRLAELIRDLRGDSSQREFARLLGISYTTIQDWEKQIRLPSSKNLQRIAQLKGCTQTELLSYLFTDEGEVKPQEEDSIESIINYVQGLSSEQIQRLQKYLELNIGSSNGEALSTENFLIQETS